MKNKSKMIVAIVLFAVAALAFAGYHYYVAHDPTINVTVGEKPAPTVPQDMMAKPNPVPPANNPQPSLKPPKPSFVMNVPAPVTVKPVAKPEPQPAAIILHRIGYSGIYSLPDNATVLSVTLDGKLTKDWAVTENKNLDVFQAKLDSKVSAVIK